MQRRSTTTKAGSSSIAVNTPSKRSDTSSLRVATTGSLGSGEDKVTFDSVPTHKLTSIPYTKLPIVDRQEELPRAYGLPPYPYILSSVVAQGINGVYSFYGSTVSADQFVFNAELWFYGLALDTDREHATDVVANALQKVGALDSVQDGGIYVVAKPGMPYAAGEACKVSFQKGSDATQIASSFLTCERQLVLPVVTADGTIRKGVCLVAVDPGDRQGVNARQKHLMDKLTVQLTCSALAHPGFQRHTVYYVVGLAAQALYRLSVRCKDAAMHRRLTQLVLALQHYPGLTVWRNNGDVEIFLRVCRVSFVETLLKERSFTVTVPVFGEVQLEFKAPQFSVDSFVKYANPLVLPYVGVVQLMQHHRRVRSFALRSMNVCPTEDDLEKIHNTLCSEIGITFESERLAECIKVVPYRSGKGCYLLLNSTRECTDRVLTNGFVETAAHLLYFLPFHSRDATSVSDDDTKSYAGSQSTLGEDEDEEPCTPTAAAAAALFESMMH